MPLRDTVELVDESGGSLGSCGKLAAHEAPGRLHRAFSVFLFAPGDRLLLQRRALGKYHFPDIWANSCCSHPAPGEDVAASAVRRLTEELGVVGLGSGEPAGDALVVRGGLADCGSFVYRAVDPVSGLVEHEFDHVLVGEACLADGASPGPNDLPPAAEDEVEELRWIEIGEAVRLSRSAGYAPWFAEALQLALAMRQPQ